MVKAKTNNKKKRIKIILIVVSVILLLLLLLKYFAAKSRLPDSMSMNAPMNHSSMSNMTSVDSLIMKKTNAPIKNFVITAEVVKKQGLPDAWTFNDTAPGSTIRVTQGDHVHVTLINKLPVATSIHWHGLSVPNAEDGVTGVTQNAVKPGESYSYDFIASDDPGTYWYHSHQNPDEQIAKGLFGAFIIDPVKKPQYVHDYILTYGNYQGAYANGFEAFWKNLLQNTREKQSVAINGNSETTTFKARPGETIRLRLINATVGDFEGKPLRIAIAGASFQVMALDGHDLHEPQVIKEQILPIGSGQRFDVLLTMPKSGSVQLIDLDGEEKSILGNEKVITNDVKKFSVFSFINYGTKVDDPLASKTKFDVTYQMDIGARPGFHDGDLAFVGTINGKQSPDVPMLMVKPGQMVHMRMVNNSIQAHPMHLHGHIMTVLKMNDKPLTGSPVHLDSVLLERGESIDVAFVADNPGLWMIHCHVTNHAKHGLSMMMGYQGISTPYSVGRATENIPE